MKKFRGFTLTELMIALSVIGIITAVVTPAVMRIRPNKNKMMIKKAYYTTENIISNLLNDANYYEDASDNTEATYLGFDVLNETRVQGNTIAENSNRKFAELFASKLNVKNCPFNEGYDGSFKICTTTDGMTWYLPVTTFGGGWEEDTSGLEVRDGEGGSVVDPKMKYGDTTIFIDVNGAANEPNCRQNNKTYNGFNTSGCDAENFDTFGIKIYEDGKMQIDDADVKATSYVELDTKITE